MKIACPSCSAKYSIADEKVHNRLAKIRCRKCGTTIVIDGKSNPPAVHAASGGSSVHPQATTVSHAPSASVGPGSVGPGLSSYTVDLSEHDQPTMTVAEIVHAYNIGSITADTYVWRDGMADWAPLADVPEINEALHYAASVSSHPPAPAAAAPVYVAPAAPAFEAQSPVFPTAAAREPVRAAVRNEGRAADLFGGIDTAGSERDLAAGQDPNAPVTTATTGARNESSVLFSLSALTASEQRGSSKSTDDSGLIDLAALTSASAADPAQSVDLGAAPFGGLGSSPLGAAPLLSGGTTSPLGDPSAHAPAPNRNGLFIGGGIAVAAVVAGLVYLLKEEPPVASAVIPTATVVVTATVAAPPQDAPDTKTADAEDDDKAEDEKKAATTTKRTAPARRPAAATPKPSDGDKPAASKDPAPADKAKPAPAPKKSTCNCAPSDLMCNMKCSAK